jgi:Tripartite tricarboxylate transporter TctB family
MAAGEPQPQRGDGPLSNILSQKRDYYAGGLMSLIGVGVILEARHYSLGTLFHMGPGFFPIILGVTLTLIGILIAAAAAVAPPAEEDLLQLPSPQWRAWICILAGPILFMVLGTYGGLVPATFACVFVSALGDRESTVRNSFFLAVGITIFAVALFSYLLQVSMPIWRWGTL